MAHREASVIVYVCDACEREFIYDADEPAPGFHGTVRAVLSAGGSDTIDWFACRETHIKAAVIQALAERGW